MRFIQNHEQRLAVPSRKYFSGRMCFLLGVGLRAFESCVIP